MKENFTNTIQAVLRGKTILVIEDTLTCYYYLNEVLRLANANVVWAANGKETLSIYQQSKTFDLVLLNVRLPDISSFELAGILKKMKPEIPIIACTAYIEREVIQKCLDSGCDDYITKPISAKELMQKILKQLILIIKKGATQNPKDS